MCSQLKLLHALNEPKFDEIDDIVHLPWYLVV